MRVRPDARHLDDEVQDGGRRRLRHRDGRARPAAPGLQDGLPRLPGRRRLDGAAAVTRGAPQNCRVEPPFPGLQTVVSTLSAPDLVAHGRSRRCPVEEPHPISTCGEFDRPRTNGNS